MKTCNFDLLIEVKEDIINRALAAAFYTSALPSIAEGTVAVTASEKRFLAQLQKIKDRNPADIDLYEVALKEAIASTSDSIDLASEDASARSAKLSAEDKRAKEEAESTLAAEDSKGKPPEAANTAEAKPDEGKPKRKPPTLMRPGEKPQ